MLTIKQFLIDRELYNDYLYERDNLIAKDIFEKQNNKKVKDKIKADCIHYHNLGFSYRKIGLQLGISYQTAFNYINSPLSPQ